MFNLQEKLFGVLKESITNASIKGFPLTNVKCGVIAVTYSSTVCEHFSLLGKFGIQNYNSALWEDERTGKNVFISCCFYEKLIVNVMCFISASLHVMSH